MRNREHAYCAIFGALALALPALFHVFGPVGPFLLPLYWPLVTLAFLVRTRAAVTMAFLVPLVSGLLTGMPLLWPPLAGVVALELAVQVALLGVVRRWTDRPSRAVAGSGLRVAVALALVLAFGRFLHAGLVYLLALGFTLPAGLAAGTVLLAGWPGVALMVLFVPVFVRAAVRKDGVCEVGFLKTLRRAHVPEGAVLVAGQVLRWFEALAREAEVLAQAMVLRRAAAGASVRAAEPSANAVIRVHNLCVTYPGASAPALELADFSLKPGEKVALLGPNGSGKSTLLGVVAGFVPYAGAVRVFGAAPAAARARMGVLFENPDDQFVFPTLREDVGYALAEKERTDGLLTAVGLAAANRPVAALSRGQRQRAALAGLLASDPELLLLDEPTAALDENERDRIADLLARHPAAMLVATHDRAFAARVCTRTLELGKR